MCIYIHIHMNKHNLNANSGRCKNMYIYAYIHIYMFIGMTLYKDFKKDPVTMQKNFSELQIQLSEVGTCSGTAGMFDI
jgi:hypothetical protein